jgi:hypothetical protein
MNKEYEELFKMNEEYEKAKIKIVNSIVTLVLTLIINNVIPPLLIKQVLIIFNRYFACVPILSYKELLFILITCKITFGKIKFKFNIDK